MFTLFRFEFEGEGDNDLSFKEGDVISLKDRDGEWLKGELRGKSGLFPLAFVEIIEDLPVESTIQNKVRFCFWGIFCSAIRY